MDARRLKKARMQLGLSQAALASALGVSQPLVCMMEAGTTPVTRRTEKQMTVLRRDAVRATHYTQAARILGRTVEEIGGRDEELEEL